MLLYYASVIHYMTTNTRTCQSFFLYMFTSNVVCDMVTNESILNFYNDYLLFLLTLTRNLM